MGNPNVNPPHCDVVNDGVVMPEWANGGSGFLPNIVQPNFYVYLDPTVGKFVSTVVTR
jgi:hypothetical protein